MSTPDGYPSGRRIRTYDEHVKWRNKERKLKNGTWRKEMRAKHEGERMAGHYDPDEDDDDE